MNNKDLIDLEMRFIMDLQDLHIFRTVVQEGGITHPAYAYVSDLTCALEWNAARQIVEHQKATGGQGVKVHRQPPDPSRWARRSGGCAWLNRSRRVRLFVSASVASGNGGTSAGGGSGGRGRRG